jgi:tyrosyl-tRNA synthetase
MRNIVEELKWRGMLSDIMPGAEEHLIKGPAVGYVGFDPTAPSLHIGSLATAMFLVHFQQAGHIPIALIGGATGMVGDPSGKSDERKFLSEEELRYNEQQVEKQLRKFLDFEAPKNPAKTVNNYDWFKDIGFIEFLREAGKLITVNYMIAKESVKKRMETGISYTEFSYQLMQAYDFYVLNQKQNCTLQMGGSDQWGNIVTGTEFIRRKSGKEAYGLIGPLLTKSDGSKFGKTEQGNVWLDPEMTSPYKFYQFFLNISDDEALKLNRVYTLKDHVEIESLEKLQSENPSGRVLQKSLAAELTERVHSGDDLKMVISASEILFGSNPNEALKSIDEKTFLEVFEGVPRVRINRSAVQNIEDLPEFLSEKTSGNIFASKGEARRMIQGGGLSINRQKIDPNTWDGKIELIQNKYLIIQKGKKNYYLIVVNS